MQVKKQQLGLDMGQLTGSILGNEYDRSVYCHPAYFYAEYIMRHAGLDEAQGGIRIVGRNINNLRYTDDNTVMAQSEEELKGLLMKKGVKKLASNSTFRKLRSWHPVPSLHGK